MLAEKVFRLDYKSPYICATNRYDFAPWCHVVGGQNQFPPDYALIKHLDREEVVMDI